MSAIRKIRWCLAGVLTTLVGIQICFCSGCYEQPETGKDNVPKIDFDKSVKLDGHLVTAKRVKISEHDYIFIDGSKWCNGVVHDPDCERCYKRRNSLGL